MNQSEGPDGGFWVFAYGSLMWKPGFEVAEARLARLDHYHRSFALSSIHYRGTPTFPGLVLGLDWRPGAACTGMALRIRAAGAATVRRYLADRELVSRAYFEVLHSVKLLCPGAGNSPRAGATVDAICYIVDRTHPQYAGGMALDEKAAIVGRAHGPSGSNREYLFNTAAHLRELQIDDPELFALEQLVRNGV